MKPNIREKVEELESLTEEYLHLLYIMSNSSVWGDIHYNYAGSSAEAVRYFNQQIKQVLDIIEEKVYEESK